MGKKALNIPQKSVDAATIVGGAGAYVNLGSVTQYPLRIPLIQNYTNGYAQISIDGGATDFMVIAPGAVEVLDLCSNSVARDAHDDGLKLGKGIQVKVKSATGLTAITTGIIYFSGIYEQGD